MLERMKQLNFCCAFTLFLGCWLGVAGFAHAFMQNGHDLNGSDYKKSENYETSKNETYESSTNYSFRLEGMSRKAALKTIADKAGLTLAYCSGLFKKSASVSVIGNEMNFEQAIRKVLDGSKLGFKITNSRHLVVFQKEKANVAGKVVDQSTGMPLQGARVMLVDRNESYSADASIQRATFVKPDGEYEIKDVDPGTYKLVIAYFGYKKAFEHVHVTRGTTVGNFEIEEKEN